MSYWPLALLSVAVCWLLHRVYSLAKIPVNDLVKILHIDIPKASKVSIDNITDQKVFLHWDLPTTEQRIVNFVIYVNGRQAYTLGGTESHCSITNLMPNTRYKLDLVSINNKGYKAKGDSIYIKTKSVKVQNYPNSILLENPENLFRLLTDNADVSNVQKLTSSSSGGESSKANPPNLASRSRSNTVNSVNDGGLGLSNASINNSPDPRSMDDIEELRYYLESGQEELHSILNQQAQALKDFHDQESILIEERDKLRDRKKLEDGNRQSMKFEIKMLDDSRRLTELKKAKQEAQLAIKKKFIEKMGSDLESWNRKIEEFEVKKKEMEESETDIHEELDSKIKSKKQKIKELQASLAKVEDEIKSFNVQKKQLEQQKPQMTKLLKLLTEKTDSAGCLEAEGIRALDELGKVNPKVQQEIKAQIDLDTRLEAEWRAQQQREVNNCLKASKAYDLLKFENNNLKSGWISSTTQPNGADKAQQASSGLTSLMASLNNQEYTQNNFSVPIVNSNPHNLSYNNYLSGSSPSLHSTLQQQAQAQTQQQLQSQSDQPQESNSATQFQIPTLWNNTSNSRLLLNTNLSKTEDEYNEIIDSPLVNHFLPADLIGDDLSDLLMSNQQEDNLMSHHSTPSSTNADTASTSLNAPAQTTSAFATNSTFRPNTNDSSANLSTRSIFHGDFALSPKPRFSLDDPASPPQSFQNEFLSANNSPSNFNNSSTNNNNSNDITSIFSGGTGSIQDILQASISASAPSSSQNPLPQNSTENGNKDSHLSSFSPRRLSNVFSFGGNRVKNHELNDEITQTSSHNTLASITQASSSSSKQSKFFHRNQNSKNDLNDTPFFTLSNQPTNSSVDANSNGVFNTLDNVWRDSLFQNNIHNRNVSINSAGSNSALEKDTLSWSLFHNGNTGNVNTKNSINSLGPGTSSNTSFEQESPENISDNGNELGVPVVLTNSKSSHSTSIRSMKSSVESSTSSPSFFRKKNFFPFGSSQNSADSTEKSPVKNSSSQRSSSPSKIDANDDPEIADFNPQIQITTPKRLFSRNSRKSSSSNIRKHSNSSSVANLNSDPNESSATEGASIQSSSTANSRSIVRKLSFFGNKGNNNSVQKDGIDDIDERLENEDT